MKVKMGQCTELKLDVKGEGTFKAIFARMNVIDHDGDVTLNGAFGEQKVLISQYNHGSWQPGVKGLPIGVGEIHEEGDNAIVEGEFDLSDNDAKRTYEKLKYLDSKDRRVEWSYALPEITAKYGQFEGQDVRFIEKVKVPEVSPVLMGAGIETEMLNIKGLKTAIKQHTTPTDDAAWDAGKNEKKVKSGQDRAYYSKIYAWYNPDGDEGVKSTYKFIHHFVDTDGTPGSSSTRAASAGIAVLNGGRGGANIPDSERQAVYNHLAKHLKDAGKEPPELRSIDSNGNKMPLIDHIEFVKSNISEVIERIEEIANIREEKGRRFSETSLSHVQSLKGDLDNLSRRLDSIKDTENEVMQEFLKFNRIISEGRKLHAE